MGEVQKSINPMETTDTRAHVGLHSILILYINVYNAVHSFRILHVSNHKNPPNPKVLVI